MINLISDTVTRPTREMREAMMRAEVGDDVFGQDPTVNKLEEKAADMFGKEAALYCPSGTMTNQIAIQCHCGRLEEVICDKTAHVYQYETSGYAYNANVGVKLLDGMFGKITPDMVEAAIQPDYDWLPKSRLVVVENSCNRGGGTLYDLKEMDALSQTARQNGLNIHLDGARLFNVLVETGDRTNEVGALFDSISICLSKGLGAPVGSLLIGDRDFITQARRLRKVMGGGMRQAGIIAAAGIYALDHHTDRLKIDNDRAKQLGKALQSMSYVSTIRPVQTNIVIFELAEHIHSNDFVALLKEKGINTAAFGPTMVRLVTHLDLDDEDMLNTLRVFQELEGNL